MTRLGHGLFTLILVWTLNACLLRSTAFAEPNDAVRILILNVVNKAGIPNKVLTPARDHVERIYRNIGIQIVWRMDGDEGMSEGNAIELTIVLLPPHLAGPFEQASACTGFAVGNDGRGARRAYVFSRRVNDQADQVLRKTHVPNLKTARGLVLGHVIAHEAGHLMLPHGAHNTKGIMKARTDLKSWEKAFRESLLFTPEEAELIRAALFGQTAQQ
jgi:hypothetical protein